jgi:nucleoside phosphorylase
VLVNTGKYSANVASALQIALLKYRIRGVLYFGNAGDLTYVSDNIDSVVIPSKVAFTGIWDWLNLNEDEEGELLFGNFNEGANVRNELAGIKFKNVTLYTGKNEVSYPRYLETPEKWMKLAESIKKQLPDMTIEVGPKASSSDIRVKNKAYATFLHKTFKFKIVDEDSAPVALVSKSNDKPYIAFHGVSNSAREGGTDPKMKLTATKNAYKVLRTFLKSLPEPRGYITTYV